MKKMIVIIAGVLALSSVGSNTQAQSFRNCAEGLNPGSSAEALIRCIAELSFRLERTEFELQNVERRIFSVMEEVQIAPIPSGAVIAFDLAKGCPAGWRSYPQLAGRMVIGVGRGSVDERGRFLTPRELYDDGGNEKVALNLKEMPPHRHTITSSPPDTNIHDGFGGSGSNFGLRPEFDPSVEARPGWSTTQHRFFMSEEGKGEAHDNMPPFLALHYCIKS